MQKYTYFQALLLSFFSKDFYRDVAKNHKGYGFKYILVLTSLFSVLFAFIWIYSISQIDEEQLSNIVIENIIDNKTGNRKGFENSINNFFEIISSVPNIKIKKGRTFAEQNEPIHIKHPQKSYPIAIIDTLGTTKYLEDTDASILISDDSVSFYDQEGEVTELTIVELEQNLFVGEDDLNLIFDIISQIPKLKFENDKLLVNKDIEQPYVIQNTDKKKAVVIIDTTNTITNFDNTDASLIFTSNSILQKNDDEIVEILYRDIKEEDLSFFIKDIISKTKRFLMLVFPFIAIPIIIGISFSFTVITLFMYGIIALSFAGMMRISEFTYRKAIRLSAFAITPVIIINAILPNIIGSQRLIYFIISIAYIYFAIKSVASDPETEFLAKDDDNKDGKDNDNNKD